MQPHFFGFFDYPQPFPTFCPPIPSRHRAPRPPSLFFALLLKLWGQVWAMKAPIWEFQYGDMMAKINASQTQRYLAASNPIAAGLSRRRGLQKHAHGLELHHGVARCPALSPPLKL
jgi:hypothetical protein